MDTLNQVSLPEQQLHAPSDQMLAPYGEAEFSPGSQVVYALHGRYNISSIETREINTKPIRFYKLEIQQRGPNYRPPANSHLIWIPVDSARENGLRRPMSPDDAEMVLTILANKECYFSTDEAWASLHPKLESCICLEGATGIAKVAGFLHLLKRRQIVPTTETLRFAEAVDKILFRELSSIFQEPIKSIEERVNRALRQKLLACHHA